MDNNAKSFNDIVEEKIRIKNRRIKRRMIAISILSAFLLLSVLVLFKNTKSGDLRLKSISVNCHGYKVTGNLAYNKDTKLLYLDNADYCGGADKTIYDKIEAVLYEKIDTPIKVSSFASQTKVLLDDYLKQVYIEEEDYLDKCNIYNNDSLYLEVTTQKDEKEKQFKVPLNLGNSCLK